MNNENDIDHAALWELQTAFCDLYEFHPDDEHSERQLERLYLRHKHGGSRWWTTHPSPVPDDSPGVLHWARAVDEEGARLLGGWSPWLALVTSTYWAHRQGGFPLCSLEIGALEGHVEWLQVISPLARPPYPRPEKQYPPAPSYEPELWAEFMEWRERRQKGQDWSPAALEAARIERREEQKREALEAEDLVQTQRRPWFLGGGLLDGLLGRRQPDAPPVRPVMRMRLPGVDAVDWELEEERARHEQAIAEIRSRRRRAPAPEADDALDYIRLMAEGVKKEKDDAV